MSGLAIFFLVVLRRSCGCKALQSTARQKSCTKDVDEHVFFPLQGVPKTCGIRKSQITDGAPTPIKEGSAGPWAHVVLNAARARRAVTKGCTAARIVVSPPVRALDGVGRWARGDEDPGHVVESGPPTQSPAAARSTARRTVRRLSPFRPTTGTPPPLNRGGCCRPPVSGAPHPCAHRFGPRLRVATIAARPPPGGGVPLAIVRAALYGEWGPPLPVQCRACEWAGCRAGEGEPPAATAGRLAAGRLSKLDGQRPLRNGRGSRAPTV